MNLPNYAESLKILDRASDAIEAAEYDLGGNFILAATNRAYYAYYYCITALLIIKDIRTKTHQGSRAKFSELFIKTNIFSEDVANNIRAAFELRQEADYDFDADIGREEAQDILLKAKEFYILCKDYMQKLIMGLN